MDLHPTEHQLDEDLEAEWEVERKRWFEGDSYMHQCVREYIPWELPERLAGDDRICYCEL